MKRVDVGRLALRVEGDYWNAYWAPFRDRMDDAVLLASIRMSVVQDGFIKAQFMALARDAFSSAVKNATGEEVRWEDPRPTTT